MKILTAFITIVLLSSCHAGRTIIWNFGNYDDYKKFQHLPIPKGETTYRFVREQNAERSILPITTATDFLIDGSFAEFLKKTKTTSFFVLQRDTVIYENYLNDYAAEELHCINSVSKSFLSLLIGIALEEGKITALTDPIKKYIPELADSPLSEITLEELIDMKSGIEFSEAYYNPFGNLAKFYYGTHLRKYVRDLEIKKAPGDFEYISVNTDILGWVLENAVGRSVPEYLSEKVWQPLQMEHAATWSIDSKKHNVPKFSYGLNTRTSDLLKLGYLYLNEGTFNGTYIVNSDWIERIAQIEPTGQRPNYKNHWWRAVAYQDTLNSAEQPRLLGEFETSGTAQKYYQLYTGNYYAAGFLGQFVYVCPAKELVIVRTGKQQGKTDWIRLFGLIAEHR